MTHLPRYSQLCTISFCTASRASYLHYQELYCTVVLPSLYCIVVLPSIFFVGPTFSSFWSSHCTFVSADHTFSNIHIQYTGSSKMGKWTKYINTFCQNTVFCAHFWQKQRKTLIKQDSRQAQLLSRTLIDLSDLPIRHLRPAC